jgi:DKNYY family
MRFGILCVICILSGCSGGYSTNGGTVTFTRCNEGNGCTTAPVEGADAKSFESLQGSYAKDRLHAYFKGTSVPQADAQSFKALTDYYAKDNSRVYYGNTPIVGADTGSFAVLGDAGYMRDKNDIYSNGNGIKACDLASFRLLKEDWQIDNKCAYRGGTKLPNAHPESFVVINEEYAKDAERIYSATTDKAIEGVDMATFKTNGITSARDKNRCYDGAQPTSCGLH